MDAVGMFALPYNATQFLHPIDNTNPVLGTILATHLRVDQWTMEDQRTNDTSAPKAAQDSDQWTIVDQRTIDTSARCFVEWLILKLN